MKQTVTVRVLPKKPKQEFTKKMYMYNVRFAVAITIVVILLMIMSAFVDHIDLTPCAYIIPPMWIEVGVFSGFYVWKAKNENISKYGNNGVTETSQNNNLDLEGRG